MRKVSLALLGLTALETCGESSSSRGPKPPRGSGSARSGQAEPDHDHGAGKANDGALPDEHEEPAAGSAAKSAHAEDIDIGHGNLISHDRIRKAARRLREDDSRASREEGSSAADAVRKEQSAAALQPSAGPNGELVEGSASADSSFEKASTSSQTHLIPDEHYSSEPPEEHAPGVTAKTIAGVRVLVEELGDESGPGGVRRRLIAQPYEKDWNWLSNTKARISEGATGAYNAANTNIYVKATTDRSLYDTVTIALDTLNTWPAAGHANPAYLKFISGTATARTQCQNGAGKDIVLGMIDTSSTPSFGSATKLMPIVPGSSAPERISRVPGTSAVTPMSFMHGGTYKLCYAPDGIFAGTRTNDIMSFWLTNPIIVEGVSSSCVTDNCLQNEPWHCWSAGMGEYPGKPAADWTKCLISFTIGDKRTGWDLMVLSGAVSKMTWTPLFSGETYHSVNGTVDTPATEATCASSDPEGGIWDYPAKGGPTTTFLDISASTKATIPRLGHNRNAAYTMRLCYCPNYNHNSAGTPCGAKEDYIQAFGILYIWRLNICDGDTASATDSSYCETGPYLRVLPQVRFVPLISCPMGGACKNTIFSRIAFVDLAPTNDRNFWDSNAGCATTGQTESAKTVWPSAGYTRTLSGGSRQDYKVWDTYLPRLDVSTGEQLDVCYCNGETSTSCSTPGNWFRIGHVVGGHFNLASQGDDTGSGSAAESLALAQVVGKAGMLGFVSGYTTAPFIPAAGNQEINANRFVARSDGPKFSDKAMVKLISYDAIGLKTYQGSLRTIESFYEYDKKTPANKGATLDTECGASTESSSDLVTGPTTTALAQSYHGVVNATDENAVSQYISFTGADKDKTLTIRKAGIIAICFCGMINEATSPWTCQKSLRFAGLLMIAGPSGTQTWNLPTRLVTRMTIRGSGMKAGDILRLVPKTSTCSGNVAPEATYKTACPSVEGGGCITGSNCPDVTDGSSCRLAGMTVNSGKGAYMTLQTMTKQNMSPATGIYRVATEYCDAEKTVLEFHNAVQGRGLEEGDTILISKADLLLTGGSVAAAAFSTWKADPRLRELADVFTNDFSLMDKSDSSNYNTQTNALGWKISFFDHASIAAAKKGFYVSIPLRWTNEFGTGGNNRYPFNIAFAGGSGTWSRTNVISTNAEIKGIDSTVAGSELKACWGRLSSTSVPEFYESAGEVSFFSPPNMTLAQLSLTSSAESIASPAIITFQTDGTRKEYATYSVGKSHKLVMRFLDTSKFEAYKNTELPSHTSTPAALAGISNVLENNARQSVCGQLFVELWSTDSEGFPFPKGCYYSGKYTDKEEGGGETTWREFTIIFEKSSGIKHICHDASGAAIACVYQMVLYGMSRPSLVAGGNYVDLYTKCDGCAADGSDIVFERGVTAFNVDSNAPSLVGKTQPPGTANGDPGIDKFMVIYDSGARYRDIGVSGRYATFDIRMVAKSPSKAIGSQNILRFFLMPLLQWTLSSSSTTVQCRDHFSGLISYNCGPAGTANPTLSASCYAVSPWDASRRNAIKVTMPADMKDPVTDQKTHSLRFISLETPKSGFFNKRWGIQLSKADDSAPSWSWTDGFFLKEPEGAETSGRVVINGQTGYGPKPFKTEIGNKVYVRIQLGATIWNNGKPDAGTFTLKLPAASGKTYTCQVVGAGAVPTSLPPFYDFDQDGYLDANFGVLGTYTDEGYWAAQSGPDCDYFLSHYQAIHAGQVFYIELTVTNPDNAMTKDDPSNEWRIKLRSKGVGGEAAVDMPNTGGYTFLNSENAVNKAGQPKLWYKNLGVLDEVQQPVLQPLSLKAGSIAAPTETQLYVFFQVQSFIGRMGFVKLDAPCGYDFGSACKASSLPPFYYDFSDISVAPTRNFTRIESCTGKNIVDFCGSSTTKFNRARIMVADNIVANGKYGFQITVTLATDYSQATQNGWKLFLADSRDYVVDGVMDTLNFLRNPLADGSETSQTDKAFGLYKGDFGTMPLSIKLNSMTPTSQAGNFGTMMTFDGILVPTAVATTLRIVAPAGFKFNGKPSGLVDSFIGFPDGSAGRALWKCDAPPKIETIIQNQLRFQNCQFAANVMYGFSIEVQVPNFSPSDTGNIFIIEMGYQGTDITGSGTSTRLDAKIIDAPMVKAVRNTLLDYSSNRAQDQQKMTIDLRLITALTTLDDGIVIEGQGGNSQYTFTCYSETFPFAGYERFPGNYGCQFANQRYTLYRKDTDFPAGYYKWQVEVGNPLSAIPSPGTWTFGTYAQSHNGGYPNNKIDKPVSTLGFPTRDMMPDAKLVRFSSQATQNRVDQQTGRVDRPGYRGNPQKNQLIFQFTLKNRPEEQSKIILRGPAGFEIADDCTSVVITDENEVFGPNSGSQWDPQFTKWAKAYKPTKCEAEGNRANITVPVGLDAGSTYVFRLEIANNPSSTPNPNYWTLEYNGESSLPFEGFTLMTATGVTLPPVSQSRRSSDPNNVFVNPLEFSLVPFQTVPARLENQAFGGCVRVLAPAGYEFVPLATEDSRRQLGAVGDDDALMEFDEEAHLAEKCDSAEDGSACVTEELERLRNRRRLSTTCQVDLRTADGSSRFVSGTDVICELSGTLNAGMYLWAKIKSSTKSVIAGTPYKMTVYVYNRASIGQQIDDAGGVFSIETFKDTADAKNGLESARLDLTQVQGFLTVPLMYEWSVINPDNQFMGTEPVRDVLFSLRMPDALYELDEIWILAPQGFVLSVGTTGACNNFRWEGGYNPFPTSVSPLCDCNSAWSVNGVQRCGLTLVMNGLGQGTVATQQNALKFRVDTENPSKVVSEIGNYWKCQHMKNTGSIFVNGVAQVQYEVKSEQAFRSWVVKPQLQNVAITIHNTARMAAEAYTDLMFGFLAVNNAATLKIEAMQPADFKFDAAVVEGFQIDGATGNNVLVVNNADINAGSVKLILVKNVKLGVQGGPTVFNLRTYDRVLLGGEMQDPSDLQDEKLSALGFRMPGLLSVVPGSQRLESDFAQNPSVYPVEAMFPAREQELNTAILVFRVTQTVFAKSLMLVTCEGQDRYVLEANGFSLTGTGSIDIDTVLNAVTGSLEVQLKPEGANTVSVLVPGQQYTMRFRTTPKIGQSNWRVVTYTSRAAFQAGELPTNTNDGTTPPFAPVYRLGFEINVLNNRSPPQAEIEIALKIQGNGAAVKQVIVIGPEGFDFPTQCGAMCTKYNNVGVENRRSVKLESPQGIPLLPNDLENIVIRTITPSLTPGQRTWFIQTRSGSAIAGGMQITGWAKTVGFEINQMENTKLWYPGRRALVGTHFAFTFTLGVDNGQRIEVNPPILYELYCSTMPQSGEKALLPISLPGDAPTCIDSPLTLLLASPLYAGTYSFIIGGDVPAQAPPAGQTQYFSLVIKDNIGNVLDAAYDIPAVNPLQEIPAVRAHLSWMGAPARLRTTVVNIGITFDQTARNIEGFLITFPPGLRHDIQTSTDVKNLNKRFPVAPATSWVDIGSDVILRILVDQSGNVVAPIPAGTYEFEFPILFPAQVPPENIWYFSLCGDKNCGNMLEDTSVVIPMTFPIGGFREGEVSMSAPRASSATARYAVPKIFDSSIAAAVFFMGIVYGGAWQYLGALGAFGGLLGLGSMAA
mmetsp:Transcript_863/g.1807  ORF Transcript_863/g.1807 Transcript_863/m.1807 type:complete len:3591 (+) Transcript_863:462-11234(+)